MHILKVCACIIQAVLLLEANFQKDDFTLQHEKRKVIDETVYIRPGDKWCNPEYTTPEDRASAENVPAWMPFGGGDTGVLTCHQLTCQKYCRRSFDLGHLLILRVRGRCIANIRRLHTGPGQPVRFVRGWCECQMLSYEKWFQGISRDAAWSPISRQFITQKQNNADCLNVIGLWTADDFVMVKCNETECNRWCVQNSQISACEAAGTSTDGECSRKAEICGGRCFVWTKWPPLGSDYPVNPSIAFVERNSHWSNYTLRDEVVACLCYVSTTSTAPTPPETLRAPPNTRQL